MTNCAEQVLRVEHHRRNALSLPGPGARFFFLQKGAAMSLGDLWYEVSPYIYAPLGAVVLFGSEGPLAKVSGALLLVAAATILRLRWTHRQRRAAARQQGARRY